MTGQELTADTGVAPGEVVDPGAVAGGALGVGPGQETAPADVAASLRRWLASGACQSDSGAFCAWREAGTGELAFEYPEITGYALTYLAGRDDPTPEEEAAGSRAADWLVGRLAAGDRSARAGWDGGRAYNFDLAMIANGLMAFGVRFGADAAVDQGLALAQALQDEARAEAGLASLGPSWRRTSDSDRSGWSTEGRAHLLKAVQCLLVADELGLAGAADSASLLVEKLSALQQADGRFVTAADDALTMLHPHCYALEGLWMWGTARRDYDALARARRGLDWAWSRQLASGGFPRGVASAPGGFVEEESIEQVDLSAQVVRMALLLGLEPEGLSHGVARLASLARADGPGAGAADGSGAGAADGPGADAADGPGPAALVYQPAAPTIHLNAWVTMFGAQALELAAGASVHWRGLV